MKKYGKKYVRGHEILIRWPNGEEDIYTDTKEPVKDLRPCTRCGRLPTPEGYDSCIGYVEEAKYVCCGHGKEHGIIMLKNGRNIILIDDEKDKRVKKINVEYEEK
ncbi:MAG: hypothetical protein LBB45_06685 [Methanobrevibacter sp.]|jgi:hypothetical protein|nr:hypothetical protein [Candidatus Methanovirga basalitermitum]